MVWNRLLGATSVVLLLGASPPPPFDLASLSVGKPVVGIPHTAGRPLVIVAFASWCVPCVREMPQVLADYQRFKARADFVGVDYLDRPAAGDAMIAKFRIPFPVVKSDPDDAVGPGADANESAPATTIRLAGVTPATLPAVIGVMRGKVSATVQATLDDVAAYCSAHTNDACVEYAAAHHVEFSAAGVPSPGPASASGTTSVTSSVTLPHLFVVDAAGIVRGAVGGYDPDVDPIVEELTKVGIDGAENSSKPSER